MAYLKPQSPIRNKEDYIYPLTTYDQIIFPDGNRWDGLIAVQKEQTVDLLSNEWILNEDGTYTQEVAVEGILSADYPDVEIDMSNASVENSIDLQDNWALIGRAKPRNGSIIFYCYDGVPIISMSVIVKFIHLEHPTLTYAEEASF